MSERPSVALGRRIHRHLANRHGDRFRALYIISADSAGDGTEIVASYVAIIDGMPNIDSRHSAVTGTSDQAYDDWLELLPDAPIDFSLRYYSAPRAWRPDAGWQLISAFRAARGSATAAASDIELIDRITPDNLNVGQPAPSLCDYCGRQVSEYATLTADWQQSEEHRGEQYELHICESCFFGRIVAEIERERWAETMYEDQPYQPGTLEREARRRARDERDE